jgi:hypothetical protein
MVNGIGEIVESNGTCKRCGLISPQVVCWRSDIEGVR